MNKINNIISFCTGRLFAICTLTTLFTLVSCTDSVVNESDPSIGDEPLSLKINAIYPSGNISRSGNSLVDASTKKLGFEVNDAIGVYLSDKELEGENLKSAHRVNVKMVFNGNKWVVDASQSGDNDLNYNYESLNKNHYVYAYYPYEVNHKPANNELSVPTDQENIANEKELLKLYSVPASHSPGDGVTLNFNQIFSSIDIKIDSSIEIPQVTISNSTNPIYTSCSFSLTNKSFRETPFYENPKPLGNTTKDITMRKIGKNHFRAILPAQILSTNTVFKADGKPVFTFKNKGLPLQRGILDVLNTDKDGENKFNNTYILYEALVEKGVTQENFEKGKTMLSLVVNVSENKEKAVLIPLFEEYYKTPYLSGNDFSLIVPPKSFSLIDGEANTIALDLLAACPPAKHCRNLLVEYSDMNDTFQFFVPSGHEFIEAMTPLTLMLQTGDMNNSEYPSDIPNVYLRQFYDNTFYYVTSTLIWVKPLSSSEENIYFYNANWKKRSFLEGNIPSGFYITPSPRVANNTSGEFTVIPFRKHELNK